MRFLLAIHNAYIDFTSGAAHSTRIMMEWLAEAGHSCDVLCTTRFDGRAPADIRRLLGELRIVFRELPARNERRQDGAILATLPTLAFEHRGVQVRMLLTRHNARPDAAETAQFGFLFDQLFRETKPALVLAYGGHPAVQDALRRARAGGAATVFSVRNHGYEKRHWFQHADHVMCTSAFLSRSYLGKIGLISTALPSPLAWSEVAAPEETRGFVTFINPSLHKGGAVFVRLADMLGRRRPDIPLLVVQSATDASVLNSFPEVDFSKYPQIVASPPIARARDLFALTRILLVPSVFAEPFGRSAAEAMINGIPPLVSNRGGLPETVAEGGLVIAIPDWLTPGLHRLPDEAETEPWFQAVCTLWDDADRYREASDKARQAASRLYDEAALRRTYIDYLTTRQPGGHPFV